ncbi:MAG TPA: BTAD domain-containing putative transcriptional regulator [Ilumatobacter sp.]|nr:BTAD domain-containing putative transcriptional regulator [Ilumatobacter sp.]
MGTSARLGVEVLGPIRVVDHAGVDVTPEGPLQRRLLALLVLRRGHVVSADAAIDVLWPGRPPREPAAALQNHVSRLRRGLPDGLIESVGDGYRLTASDIELDADRLLGLLSTDEATDVVMAEIESVLQRWHGPAYPELADVDDGRTESTRLDEYRLRAREFRAEQLLIAGDTDGLVADLTALAEEAPLRERPRALLMSALEATGRRVEALREFDDFRRLLGDELGIEPSPVLAAQHAGLLGLADTGWQPETRLPLPVTSLIGRDALVVEVAASLDSCRLVTLAGPGGVGKTRLAVEVGRLLREGRADRSVVVCELAKAVEGSAVDVVAAALAIDARPGVALAERVASVLGDSEVVVMLDNCEHVLDPIAELAGHLLARCPNVTLLATSRERLRVPGEQVRVVPPLVLGADSPAVSLFVERARAVKPAFDPSPTELARVVEIVLRLDGLPLAIELAAACLHTHEVAEIAAGLDSRFALLSSGYRGSSHHGSLHATVAWSFELLDPRLRQTFADLSIFVGSFTVVDAAAVCALDDQTVAGHLAGLAERSLVVRVPAGRYALLETLRAFAAEQLATTGRDDLVGERHARWFVEWAERAERRLHVPGQSVLTEIDHAIPELQLALGWLIGHHLVEQAGRLVAAVTSYALLRLRPDVLAWAERVIAADSDGQAPNASQVWAAAAYHAWMAGDLAESGARSARAVAICEREPGGLSQVVATIRGNHDLFEGRLDAAASWYRRGVVTAGADSARRLIAAGAELLALGYAGAPAASALADSLLLEIGEAETPVAAYVWYCTGEAAMGFDVERAQEWLGRAVELAEATNASFVRGVAGASKASIEARIGDPAVAAADYRWLIPHWQRAGMWSTQWTTLRSIAPLLERLGRHRDAAVLEGAVRATGSGHRIFGADEVTLRELGARLSVVLGDDGYRAALDQGASLDGDAAIEHALRAL